MNIELFFEKIELRESVFSRISDYIDELFISYGGKIGMVLNTVNKDRSEKERELSNKLVANGKKFFKGSVTPERESDQSSSVLIGDDIYFPKDQFTSEELKEVEEVAEEIQALLRQEKILVAQIQDMSDRNKRSVKRKIK